MTSSRRGSPVWKIKSFSRVCGKTPASAFASCATFRAAAAPLHSFLLKTMWKVERWCVFQTAIYDCPGTVLLRYLPRQHTCPTRTWSRALYDLQDAMLRLGEVFDRFSCCFDTFLIGTPMWVGTFKMRCLIWVECSIASLVVSIHSSSAYRMYWDWSTSKMRDSPGWSVRSLL